MGVKIRQFVLIYVCSLMFGCASVTHIPDLNRALDKAHFQFKRDKINIEREYPISHAQYETVKRQIKGANVPKFKQLTSQFKEIKRLKNEFQDRYTKLYSITTQQRQIWGSRATVTSDDPEWNELDKFIDYSKSESKSLINIRNNYREGLSEFKNILNSEEVRPYTKNLPRNLYWARRVLQEIEQEKSYEQYNKELLENLEARAISIPKDFESLAELANFDKYAQSKKMQYGRFPRGKSGPSTETYIKANNIISSTINPNIVSAAKNYTNKQTSVEDVTKNLLSVRNGRFSHLAIFVSKQNIQAIDKIFSNRRTEILESLVLVELAKANKIAMSRKSIDTKLKELVVLQSEFTKKHSRLLDESVVKNYLSKLQNQRNKLLRQIEPRIVASIKSAKSIADLKDPLSGLLARDDRKLDVVLRIRQAQSNKLKKLAEFRPVRHASQLEVSSFTAKGLNYESELLAIYLGDFKNSRLKRDDLVVSHLFRKYLEAYGRFCHEYLPTNKVPITESKCKTERVTTNGWGVETGRSCVEWVDVPTGLYAEPMLYNASSIASRNSSINMFGAVLSGNDPFAIRSLGDDVLSIGNDMSNLVKNNKCNNAGLKRFEKNLYNFIKGRAPLLLPGKETLALIHSIYKKNHDADNLNLKGLLDDLILENSKGWMMNRYRSGSVSNINISDRNDDGSPRRVKASYNYSSLGKIYRGNVSLAFANDIPQCLYFSDAPRTCRKPSRGIVNKYERGGYMK